MNKFECTGCPYYWKEEEDDFPRCQYNGLDVAPCEREEYDDYYNEEQ